MAWTGYVDSVRVSWDGERDAHATVTVRAQATDPVPSSSNRVRIGERLISVEFMEWNVDDTFVMFEVDGDGRGFAIGGAVASVPAVPDAPPVGRATMAVNPAEEVQRLRGKIVELECRLSGAKAEIITLQRRLDRVPEAALGSLLRNAHPRGCGDEHLAVLEDWLEASDFDAQRLQNVAQKLVSFRKKRERRVQKAAAAARAAERAAYLTSGGSLPPDDEELPF